ncbi:MAG: flagellar hook-basal body complex protein FliE [Clostridium sp.]|uniref:flagellar hook-basal body complex protein FliE n=1 Tax=Clostridium sp. TaxID=1506 RepID=UPI003F354032
MVINGFTPNEEIFKKDIFDGVKSKEVSNKGFTSKLKEKLDEVNNLQKISEEKQVSFIKGEDVDIHEVMLAGQEAKLSLQYAVEVRNKVVEAYQEISRMQL